MTGDLLELTEIHYWKDMNPKCIEATQNMLPELCSQMTPNSCFQLEGKIKHLSNGKKYEIYLQIL